MGIFKDFTDVSIHFSNAMGTPIFNENKKKIGVLSDFFVDYEDVYPVVLAVQFKRNGKHFYVPWDEIQKFSFKKILIKDSSSVRTGRTYPKVCNKRVITSLLAGQFGRNTIDYPPLGKIVLDRQIVDTHGKKVVRVNDIQFIKAGRFLRVTHAAIGLRSLIRRLGYERAVDAFVRIIKPKAVYLSKDTIINWKYVHAIPDRSIQKSVRLNLSNQDIKDLHPADLADILEDLDNHARELIFNNLDPEQAADVLTEVEQDMQASFLKNEDPEDAAKIIEQMGPDEAADILLDMSDDKADAIISNIEDDEIQEEIQELLEHEEDTAGGLMSTEAFEVGPNTKKSQLLDLIQKEHEEFESIYDIYIVDEDQKLLGTCSLKKLLIQKEDIDVGEIMNSSDIKALPPSTHWKEVASYMSKYNLINVPIIDDTNELLGIISVDDTLPWLLNER